MDIASLKYIPAKHYTPAARKVGDVRWVVLHSMESQEKPDTAESVAAWFASPAAPRSSAHYCIDSNSVVRSVADEHVAWHAPGANAAGIGIEHAGRAAQARDQWLDAYGRAMLRLSVNLCAALCRKWDIPALRVWPAGLRNGVRGITTHAHVSEAFKRSTHWDPGPGFPMAWYVERVAKVLETGEDE